jgi:hypothetical protein
MQDKDGNPVIVLNYRNISGTNHKQTLHLSRRISIPLAPSLAT